MPDAPKEEPKFQTLRSQSIASATQFSENATVCTIQGNIAFEKGDWQITDNNTGMTYYCKKDEFDTFEKRTGIKIVKKMGIK